MIQYNPASDVTLGCDPELFVTREAGRVRKKRVIVPSDQFIPQDGHAAAQEGWGTIVRDGLQVELHPCITTCRESLRSYIRSCFQGLDRAVKAAEPTLGPMQIDMTQVFKLTKAEMKALTEENRRLGCMPSSNAYGREFIVLDGGKYQFRSAAGHMHFGAGFLKNLKNPARLMHLLDLFVGNTCVMIDRNPLAATRRQAYGRAGEYRIKPYGVEYRTLSNFWLTHYILESFVFGMAKQALWIFSGRSYNGKPPSVESIMKGVDLRLLEQAINENDFDLSRQIYNEHLKPFLSNLRSSNVGIDNISIHFFDTFVNRIREAELSGHKNPLSVWFPNDPVKHWVSVNDQSDGLGYYGWETFLRTNVAKYHNDKLFGQPISAVVNVSITASEPTVLNVPQASEAGARIVL